jgi:hypothetical protein
VYPKSHGGVSNNYVVGMKHDRHTKQVSNERQTHQVFHIEVDGTEDRGEEGERASSRARNVSKVTLTCRVIYRTWRSPDLTPLDFYFWGYVKQTVYSVRIHNIQHLKQRIMEVAASVTPDVLGRVWQEMEYHLDVCSATNGVRIELR